MDTVLREEEGAEAWLEGEVAELDDVVVCEVDCVVVLAPELTQDSQYALEIHAPM